MNNNLDSFLKGLTQEDRTKLPPSFALMKVSEKIEISYGPCKPYRVKRMAFVPFHKPISQFNLNNTEDGK